MDAGVAPFLALRRAPLRPQQRDGRGRNMPTGGSQRFPGSARP
jgi:hypothetical protein